MFEIINVICIIAGVIIGRVTTHKEINNEEEHLSEQVRRLEVDVAYYKKLCKQLSEENMEFRRKQ